MRLERHNKQTNRKIQGSDSAKKKIKQQEKHHTIREALSKEFIYNLNEIQKGLYSAEIGNIVFLGRRNNTKIKAGINLVRQHN